MNLMQALIVHHHLKVMAYFYHFLSLQTYPTSEVMCLEVKEVPFACARINLTLLSGF